MRLPLHRSRFALALVAGLLFSTVAVEAQGPNAWRRQELNIPMRDGARLQAIAFLPQDTSRPLPILLVRTPFGAAREFRGDAPPPQYRELAQDGYIFVAEDIRGRFASSGEFVTLRANADPRSPPGISEATDAWDTIDWLTRHLPNNNARVGVLGISYRGWLAALAGVGAHPALKAISPQAPMSDTWMGDDFFHQGAFRQTQGVAYSAYIEGGHGFPMSDDDQYAFYLRFPTLDSLARGTGVTTLPSWRAFVEHPTWDRWWQERSLPQLMPRLEVPTLFVGGFWDEEDLLGAQQIYRATAERDTAGLGYIVLGPWSHGSWARPGGDSLGPIRFGSSTAEYFRREIERPWFAWYLHGKGDGNFPRARIFESGGNQWRSFAEWPPRNRATRRIYLGANGALSFDPPRVAGFDRFVADPARPVPYVPRPDDGSGWSTWLVQDQRFVDRRPDVLTWESAPLAEDLTIAGDVTARLFASITGTDADWVVKLIDVYPDTMPDHPRMGGYQLMVNADILRGRYWKGFTRATPIPANTVTPFTIDLHQQLYRFRKGHRLMVQVQSSWFPLYDLNPQTFVPNIFRARATDYHAQEHRIWRSARYPSHLTLPVLP
jgi:uncharacterized protein